MSQSRQLAFQLGFVTSLLLLWEVVVRTGVVDARLLPPFSEVIGRLWFLLQDTKVLHHLWITTSEVLLSFVIVAPLGIALGLLLGENDFLGKAFKPFFYFMASVPKSVFLPLFILALGIGFAQKVAFGVFQALFVLVISSIAAADSVPPEFVRMGRAYGATRRQQYLQIYLPAMLPVIVEGLRLGMIFSITGVLFAEMYVSRAGLGYLIASWGARFELANLLAGILLAALLSILINETLRWIERRLGAWRVQ
jgi:ABC-type nitrate/sulfonate/bicarbonate transport system permease component